MLNKSTLSITTIALIGALSWALFSFKSLLNRLEDENKVLRAKLEATMKETDSLATMYQETYKRGSNVRFGALEGTLRLDSVSNKPHTQDWSNSVIPKDIQDVLKDFNSNLIKSKQYEEDRDG